MEQPATKHRICKQVIGCRVLGWPWRGPTSQTAPRGPLAVTEHVQCDGTPGPLRHFLKAETFSHPCLPSLKASMRRGRRHFRTTPRRKKQRLGPGAHRLPDQPARPSCFDGSPQVAAHHIDRTTNNSRRNRRLGTRESGPMPLRLAWHPSVSWRSLSVTTLSLDAPRLLLPELRFCPTTSYSEGLSPAGATQRLRRRTGRRPLLSARDETVLGFTITTWTLIVGEFGLMIH